MVQGSSLRINNINNSQNTKISRFFPLKIKNRYIDFDNKTLIMGILNITPDSFYDGGKYSSIDICLKKIDEMLSDGADIIDIGGESTRPGSESVSVDEELKRVIPVLKQSLKRFDTIFSIDTTKSEVAEEALNLGVSIINDISGLRFDKKIAKVVANKNAGIVLMHTPSRPNEMQKLTNYDSIIEDIFNSLSESISNAVECGVEFENIIVDPGIGFGKTTEQNLKIINKLRDFLDLRRPILIGTSRKSFIGNLLSGISPEQRLSGTLSSVTASILNGASIVRVHDVKEIKHAATIADAITNTH